MFYYIISTTYQKIGDLFCPVIFLDFRTVWIGWTIFRETAPLHCSHGLRKSGGRWGIHHIFVSVMPRGHTPNSDSPYVYVRPLWGAYSQRGAVPGFGCCGIWSFLFSIQGFEPKFLSVKRILSMFRPHTNLKKTSQLCLNLWNYITLGCFGTFLNHLLHTDIFHYVVSSSYLIHGSYKWIVMLKECGRPDLNVFYLKWIIGTHGNWKNQNPGGRFGATS